MKIEDVNAAVGVFNSAGAFLSQLGDEAQAVKKQIAHSESELKALYESIADAKKSLADNVASRDLQEARSRSAASEIIVAAKAEAKEVYAASASACTALDGVIDSKKKEILSLDASIRQRKEELSKIEAAKAAALKALR